jgi:hypothetical protein
MRREFVPCPIFTLVLSVRTEAMEVEGSAVRSSPLRWEPTPRLACRFGFDYRAEIRNSRESLSGLGN